MHDDRLEIAREAARLMAESGYVDWAAAKSKAASSLGLRSAAMPSNAEVAVALRDYLATIAPEETRERLRSRRAFALQLMMHLREFHPRAAGALVDGLMTERAPVELHLFADPPERVDMFLADRGWDYDDAELRLRHPSGREVFVPVCRLDTEEGVRVELLIFEADGTRWAPVSPVDGKPMARLDREALKALVARPPDDAAA